jgi:hypothetical protein
MRLKAQQMDFVIPPRGKRNQRLAPRRRMDVAPRAL